MRTEEFIKLLAEPYTVQDLEVDDLRELASQYPYSQVIQLLYGLRLRYSSAHLFNQQLGRAAALSNDRSVLFELFESKSKLVSQPTKLSVVADESEDSSAVLDNDSEEKALLAEDEAKTIKVERKELDAALQESEEEGTSEYKEPPVELQVKEDTVVEETTSPQIDKPEEPEPIESENQDALDSVPEGLSDLSPQDRVKAILARNKAIREQFEQERKGLGEKLFSKSEESSEGQSAADENLAGESVSDEPIDIASLVQRRHEAQFGKNIEEPEEAPQSDPQGPQAQTEESLQEDRKQQEEQEEQQEDLLHEERSPELIEDRGAEPEIEHSEVEEEIASPAPVDQEESTLMEEVLASEKEPQTESEILHEEIEEDVSAEAALEEEGEEELEPANPKPVVDKEDKGDIALSARIRIIRDRLEALKNSNALSEDELQVLMEEHKRLESLMSELPVDEEHVFDVEFESEQETSESGPMKFEIDALLEDAKETQRIEAGPEELAETEEELEAVAEQSDELDDQIERIQRLAAELKTEIGSGQELNQKLESDQERQSALEDHSEEQFENETSFEPEIPSDSQQDEEELSFSEWLRKIREGSVPVEEESGPREEIKAKVDLLDSFVDKLPALKKKGRAGEMPAPTVNNPSPAREESEGMGMVTETLAKVYIRQKHYKKAIQAYEILKLKYPEKSTFFASQILEIKKLAKSN